MRMLVLFDKIPQQLKCHDKRGFYFVIVGSIWRVAIVPPLTIFLFINLVD